MRTSRIDTHRRAVNPGRKQQIYCFAIPLASIDKLENADINAATRSALYRTLHLCGTFLFTQKTGSVCSRKAIMQHLKLSMSAYTARKHLRLMEELDLVALSKACFNNASTFSFEHYIEANPTTAEAAARHQARLSQLRSAQRRHRAKKRGHRATRRREITPQLHALKKSVITQSSSRRSLGEWARLTGPRPGSTHWRLGRRIQKVPSGFFYNRQGHLKPLLSDAEVAQALIEPENDLCMFADAETLGK
jgi:hypothetical protein